MSEAEVVELVAAFGDDLVLVDPDVTVAGKDIDMRAGFPVGMGLAAVGVAEGDVHAGKFFVLEEDADHFRKSEVGAEGIDLQFAWVVVNYDLPWNPMRVEQRIGRLDLSLIHI